MKILMERFFEIKYLHPRKLSINIKYLLSYIVFALIWFETQGWSF